ncbi:MAG: STAS domain-containing protein [Clostridia bacterium]|nr:STAS domain-containing protein [Clostridia bacterium]
MLKKHCKYETQIENGVLTVTLRGEIDHHSAVSVRTEIDSLIYELRPQKTVLDLSEIDFMDSSGLGLIMGRYALMQRIDGELTLKNPNERIVKIFELAGLGRIVKIEEDAEEIGAEDAEENTEKESKK